MMTTSYLLYPHQLFETVFYQKRIKTVVLVEEHLLFRYFPFHKKKLIFHRASMKAFAHRLKEEGFKVFYVDSKSIEQTEDIIPILKKSGIDKIHCFDLVDDWLRSKLFSACKNEEIAVIEEDSPNFYLSKNEVEKEFNVLKFSMALFYARQRKRFEILLENGKPVGGKWSFDTDNRKKLPKNIKLPLPPEDNGSPFIQEATEYVEKHFGSNYGEVDHFFYPITHTEARQWLGQFLKERLPLFGPYEDAIAQDQTILFHSVLSPLLNVGLLTPQEVIQEALDYAKHHPILLSGLEGFIRQILGWREFIRGVYHSIGGQERTKNFFGHTRRIPESFWKGNTGIVPVDNVIGKVVKTGYAHHIERLMVISNFMLLCEFDPHQVYAWFMSLFIDAYDWVMVPNVYGMGLYADGGMMSTKPYISSSNYLLKMGDYPKGPWTEIWNSLYWNFIDKHQATFQKNHRFQPILQMLGKLDSTTLIGHKQNAKKFLNKLDK